MHVTFRCPPELEPILPRPIAAKRGLPDWLKTMPMTVTSEDAGGEIRTVKQCPPFVDAMSCGFLMPLACDLEVRGGRFSWSWDPPAVAGAQYTRSPISTHLPEQATGAPLHEPNRAFLKFNNFWTVALPDGWSLLCLHPINRVDLPFHTLTGLVDADRFCDGLIQFPARWTEPAFEGVLPAGTPVAQCIPVLREALELSFEALDGDTAARFAEVKTALAESPGVYKERFRVRK